MPYSPRTPAEPPRALIASLWSVVLFNIIFRDIHQLLAPGFIDEFAPGH